MNKIFGCITNMKSRNTTNSTPSGQSNTTAIFNITSKAYDTSINVSVRLNHSLNKSLTDLLNLTVSLNNTKSSNIRMNHTFLQYFTNISVNNSVGMWHFLDTNITSGRFSLPVFMFVSICTECTKTFDWENATIKSD